MRLSSPKSWLNLFLEKVGYRFVKLESSKTPIQVDMDPGFQPIYEKSKTHTMTSMASMYALYKAVQYIADAKIPGDIVECGVYKGGSMMIAAMTLESMGDIDRQLWLYDTYAGMAQPTDRDVDVYGRSPRQRWQDAESGGINSWCMAPLDEVKSNLYSTAYPRQKMQFVEGKVEETIPNSLPETIALLRLDTDFFESTQHELIHLFPKLSTNGVLIIDDYGWWKGSRDATDQYFEENGVKILLHRVDSTSRVAIKARTD